MNKNVIYHSADYDGIFCREIARKFLPDARLIGWNYGDPTPEVDPTEQLYILDLSVHDLMNHPLLIWIDHHKTAIEKYPTTIPGYRIDGVAACRLAWQWFNDDGGKVFPTGKVPYVDRDVIEPLAIRLAGEYDIWDKRDPRAETFQYALRVCEKKIDWDHLLSTEHDVDVIAMLDRGEAAQVYAQQTDASTCKNRTWVMQWEGIKFLCVNSARFNSLFFAARDLPETGHEALLGFCFDGKCWTVSLYHAKHRTDIDLSEIAKRHGGGGHRGACGFTCSRLPFNLA